MNVQLQLFTVGRTFFSVHYYAEDTLSQPWYAPSVARLSLKLINPNSRMKDNRNLKHQWRLTWTLSDRMAEVFNQNVAGSCLIIVRINNCLE